MDTKTSSLSAEKLKILGKESIFVGCNVVKEVIPFDLPHATNANKYVVITDDEVHKHHFPLLHASLISGGVAAEKILVFQLPKGEQSKTREKKAEIEDWMLDHACNRDTCVIALGGGVFVQMLLIFSVIVCGDVSFMFSFIFLCFIFLCLLFLCFLLFCFQTNRSGWRFSRICCSNLFERCSIYSNSNNSFGKFPFLIQQQFAYHKHFLHHLCSFQHNKPLTCECNRQWWIQALAERLV
jgi:hypothetical protein